jgi:DNA-binding transcriptional LysR family regulator
MKIRQLQMFLAVAEHLNFRKAAEEFGLTQAALSLAIQNLEDEIGVSLLLRGHQETRLTYAGNVFRADISEMLTTAQHAAEHTRRASTGILHQLKVGFISTAITGHFLPKLVAEFRQSHPQVELRLQNHINTEQLTLVEAGALDVGFIRLPLLFPHDVEMLTVHSEEHVVVVSKDSPLAQQTTIRPRDIEGSSFIMYSRRNAPGYHDMIMRTLNNNGINPDVVQEVGEMYTLVSLVSAGIGIAIAPISAHNYNLPGLAFLRADWLPPAEIGVILRKHTTQTATRLFIDMALRTREKSYA